MSQGSSLSTGAERSQTQAVASQLADWSHVVEVENDVVDHITHIHDQHVRERKNDLFLAKLAAAEAPTTAKPADPVADHEPAADEKTAKQKKSKRKKRLKGQELEVASNKFWEMDSDANAILDRDEWEKMVVESGRALSVSMDEAFARADVDGDGTVDFKEWLQTKEAAWISGAEAAEAAWNGNAPPAIQISDETIDANQAPPAGPSDWEQRPGPVRSGSSGRGDTGGRISGGGGGSRQHSAGSSSDSRQCTYCKTGSNGNTSSAAGSATAGSAAGSRPQYAEAFTFSDSEWDVGAPRADPMNSQPSSAHHHKRRHRKHRLSHKATPAGISSDGREPAEQQCAGQHADGSQAAAHHHSHSKHYASHQHHSSHHSSHHGHRQHSHTRQHRRSKEGSGEP